MISEYIVSGLTKRTTITQVNLGSTTLYMNATDKCNFIYTVGEGTIYENNSPKNPQQIYMSVKRD